MKTFSNEDLDEMSRFYRANLINCLTGIKPALLVGTQSKDGNSNLALFSSVFHVGADPAIIGLVQRPLTDFSHTYKNICETGCYTLNHVPTALLRSAHHTSAKFSAEDSEFLACGFREFRLGDFPAPFVEESAVRLGLRFLREIPLPENGTRLLLGSVVSIQVQDDLLLSDGNLDFSKDKSCGVAGLETYVRPVVVSTFEYAKPGVAPLERVR
jgi:flavin reductase (DIM6/NTAB) family NADH-FMN oxidoreductase RutF